MYSPLNSNPQVLKTHKTFTIAMDGYEAQRVSQRRQKMKVSTVAQMRNLDRSAIEEFGISDELLMENAGQAVYFAILKKFGIKNRKFVIF